MSTQAAVISEETAVVANLETRYLHGGAADAPVVVFMHDGAWGGASDVTWGKILPVAAQSYRVIAPDFLGYGGSAKSVRVDVSPFAFRIKHVFSLLDALGITAPVHLVGNSFGGSMGLRALSDPAYRSRIASVTTINGTGGPWKAPDMAKIGEFDGNRESLEAIVEILCDDSADRAELVDARLRWATAPGHFTCMRAPHFPVPEALKAERPADPFPENLRGIDTPVLLVEGANDTLLESGWNQKLAELLPGATAKTIDTKHCPNITHPDETWALLNEFLSAQIAGAAA